MSRNFELMQELAAVSTASSRRFDSTSTYVADSDAASTVNLKSGYPADHEALGIVQRIFLVQSQTPPRVVVFTGVDHGVGCSRIAASTATTLARNTPGQVCLVEANFRSPALPEFFGVTNHHGLADALLQDGPIRSFIKPVVRDKLWLLSCGAQTDSANVMPAERVKARLTELRSEFDFVIVDAPPLNKYDDAIPLAQFTDGVVLVLEAGATRREAAQTATASLRTANIPVLGAVLNKRTFPIPDSIYKRL
jgi:Mrp family chromosome partitioning ATPase